MAEGVHFHGLITGGSSGIGFGVARLLVGRGASVSLLARDRAKLAAARVALETVRIQTTQQIRTFAVDVSDRAALDRAVLEAIAALGPPDLAVASAGIARPGYFHELPPEAFERAIAVNYFGSLYTARAVLPSMRDRGRGHLVFVSSGAGLIGIYGYTAYAPSKFAVRGLAESLRPELRGTGVSVSVVYPPDTDTPQLAEEMKTKPPETRRITATAQTWSAEAVAAAILRGVDRQQFAIAPGLEMTWLNRLHSLLFPLLNWYFDRLAAPR